MADTRIVLPICTVISSRARLAIVVWWLACPTLGPGNQGRFPAGHLLQNVFFFFFFFFFGGGGSVSDKDDHLWCFFISI